jgi:P27 family predicted phage terminase small subunit
MSNDKRPKPVGNNELNKAPTWLNANSKKIYKKTAEEIKKLGIADRCDTNILAIFSAQLDRLQVVSQLPEKELFHERLQNDLTSSVLSLSKELGITPSARAKLRIARVEVDDIDSFLSDE